MSAAPARATDAPKIGVGVIGLGNSGWYYHAEGSLQSSPDFDLMAVCDADADQANRASAAFGVSAFTDWQALLEEEAIQLVVVALPHHLHHEVSVACSRAGKHVLVEKPMATTTEHARAMIDAADKAGRRLAVFHQRRWDPDFRVIQNAVRAGKVGDIWRVETRRSNAGDYRVAGPDSPHAGTAVAAWAHTRAGGGGVVYLAAPHLVDHLLHLFGRVPRTVTAHTHRGPAEDVETYVEIVLDFGDGLLARAEVCPAAPVNPPKWAVYGTAGTIASRDGSEVTIAPTQGEHQVIGKLPRLRHCDEFYETLATAIRTDGPLPVEPEEGQWVTAVLQAAQHSAAAGGVPVIPDRNAGS